MTINEGPPPKKNKMQKKKNRQNWLLPEQEMLNLLFEEYFVMSYVLIFKTGHLHVIERASYEGDEKLLMLKVYNECSQKCSYFLRCPIVDEWKHSFKLIYLPLSAGKFLKLL